MKLEVYFPSDLSQGVIESAPGSPVSWKIVKNVAIDADGDEFPPGVGVNQGALPEQQ